MDRELTDLNVNKLQLQIAGVQAAGLPHSSLLPNRTCTSEKRMNCGMTSSGRAPWTLIHGKSLPVASSKLTPYADSYRVQGNNV